MKATVVPTPHLRRLGWVITIVSLAAIAFATLMPAPDDTITTSHFCLICGLVGGVSAILNVFLFVPLGIGLAFAQWSAKRALIAMCALSVLIETAQLVIPGRDSTLGDVLTNSFGGALGFAIGRYAFALLRPSPRLALALCIGWSALWLGIQTISSFGLSPAFPTTDYYGEIAPQLGNFEQFRGRLLRAGIADIGVSDTRFENSAQVRDLLLRGAPVTTTVVPSNPTHGIAPIVRVADEREREIALLAQSGNNLVFGVRTGAAVLRLRPLLFALPDVFATRVSSLALAADTLRLGGRYVARGVKMNAQSRSATRDRHIPLSASLGWTFWLPFPWFIEGTRAELAISWTWIACLMIPLGYWSLAISDSSRSEGILRNWAPVLLAGVALLFAGLVLVPHAFGLSAAPLRDWLATLAGVLVGCGLGALMTKLIGNTGPCDGFLEE